MNKPQSKMLLSSHSLGRARSRREFLVQSSAMIGAATASHLAVGSDGTATK